MIEICRPVWIALVATVAACGAHPKPSEPIAGTVVASQPKPAGKTTLAIAGHERIHFEPDAPGFAATETAVLDTVVQRVMNLAAEHAAVREVR